MQKRKAIRQGDVLLRPCKPRAGLSPHIEHILARGEATGHHHVVIDGEVLVDERGKLFVRATPGTKLRHQDERGAVADHLPLVVPAGDYEVLIEEEYTPHGFRPVVD